jgi:signal transduction histidine kinase
MLRHKWGILWRGVLCWGLGCLFLLSDDGSSFDTRFQVRGDRPATDEIVLITLRPNEITSTLRKQRYFSDPSEVIDVTDSYYWDQKAWADLLKKILAQNPKKVGVTFFFNENLGPARLNSEQEAVFFDSRIVWAALSSTADRPTLPLFSAYDRSNIGSIELIRDDDGVLRRFSPLHNEIPHLIERLVGKTISGTKQINYKGAQRIFPAYSMTDVIEELIPESGLRGKYVIIGPESISGTQYLTPVGSSNRAAIMAQILDNALTNSWIKKAPLGVYMLILAALEVLCIFLITQYPHTVAFIFLGWIGTLMTALSAWVFDGFAIWIPVVSPSLLILTTWIIFIGNRANEIEHRNFQLKQEQKALQELEQLKNNFVSLISHDLKTPIAKIRAIVDRMMAASPSAETLEDLEKLRDFSEELNRYIQSILKLLRVESRDFRLNLEVGDINETIEDVVQQVRPLATTKQIDILLSLEPLFSIEVDFTLVREVILNLIENAIKYTPNGGTIRVHSDEVDGFVVVEVEDNGPGIPPEDVAQVWGKFVRGRDQDLKTKGSGLGLYLVKYFVELHGGSVGIESELKKGTKVSFRLPLEPPDRFKS